MTEWTSVAGLRVDRILHDFVVGEALPGTGVEAGAFWQGFSALVHDLDQTVSLLRRLRDRGLGVAIDDFGTGYASVAYLSKFPATELKIDLSLVSGMHGDARAARLVSGIIDMAHHLGLVAVAEGIEDGGTQSLLAEMGCDFGQGYHLGRPVPAADFVARCGGRNRV